MKTVFKKTFTLFIVLIIVTFSLSFSGCKPKNETISAQSEPKIRVYNTTTKTTSEMELEKYVAGVVAGEVYNTWNDEALKVQSILARTYALKFAETNADDYKARGISTSIADAQSYDESTINDKILAAVEATKGQVITYENRLINAYFHSNSGGHTATAKVGLSSEEEPEYIKSVESPETNANSKNFQWSATFTKSEILNALSKMGISVATLSTAKLGEKSQSGHYSTLVLGGKEVSANTLRSNLGTTKMRSTKLTSLTVNTDSITIKGLGYGHGVGVSQWGAQILAEQGKTYREILDYYYNNIAITTLY